MKFDIIISNPPYNKDMYLDFVEAVYDLLNEDGMAVFITPAKFYAKGGAKNQAFREKIMPHIHNVHLYKCCTDVFDIAERGGIAYYDVYRSQIFNEKIITNHNKNVSLDDSNLSETDRTHTEQPVEFMPLSALHLINKIKQIQPHTLFENVHIPGRYAYYCKNTIAGHAKQSDSDLVLLSGVGNSLTPQGYLSLPELKTTDNINKYKVIINEMMSGKGLQLDKNNMTQGNVTTVYCKPNEIPKGSYVILYFCDTELEAQSFTSYINSQLVAYICIAQCTTNKATTNENWRHVPALPAGYKFDHIYTNEEIFKIFELTDDEIKLITNLIKPRKEK